MSEDILKGMDIPEDIQADVAAVEALPDGDASKGLLKSLLVKLGLAKSAKAEKDAGGRDKADDKENDEPEANELDDNEGDDGSDDDDNDEGEDNAGAESCDDMPAKADKKTRKSVATDEPDDNEDEDPDVSAMLKSLEAEQEAGEDDFFDASALIEKSTAALEAAAEAIEKSLARETAKDEVIVRLAKRSKAQGEKLDGMAKSLETLTASVGGAVEMNKSVADYIEGKRQSPSGTPRNTGNDGDGVLEKSNPLFDPENDTVAVPRTKGGLTMSQFLDGAKTHVARPSVQRGETTLTAEKVTSYIGKSIADVPMSHIEIAALEAGVNYDPEDLGTAK